MNKKVNIEYLSYVQSVIKNVNSVDDLLETKLFMKLKELFFLGSGN